MHFRRPFAFLFGLALAATAHADQFEYLDLSQAKAALAMLRTGDVVHLYCAPCGDTESQRMTVRTVGIDRVWDGSGGAAVYRDAAGTGFWTVVVNDRAIDLAYVYIRDGRRWRNLAGAIGLPPTDVPAELRPPALETR